jgi:D-arabinose 1-dehydrogenase-like Zn-dependent alcohol dehydrogenase
MKKTMLMVLGVTALALPLSAAAPTWLHVKVDEAGPKATTVRVNLPFTVLEVAAPLANAEWGKNVKIPGTGGLDKARLQAMWTAAKEAGDSEFVRVDSETEQVRVGRIGGRLVIQVDSGKKGEKVRVEIPGDVADALLSGTGDQLNFVAALTALKRAGHTSLVSVDGGKDKVHIWVDDRNVSE